MKVKEESGKAGLKLNIQKTKIMTSGPITSCQIDGETMKTVTHFIFLGSKITARGDSAMKLKDLFLGRKAITILDSIFKNRDNYFANKGLSSQSYGFSSSHVIDARGGTIKKAECRRIDAFQLWCWKRLLRVPWTARRSSHSILKEISLENSLEGLMLKLKLQYLGHL